MKINLFFLIIACCLCTCASGETISNKPSYHFFRTGGKIGIVDSEGTVTCEPKFASDNFFPTEFKNELHTTFTNLYDDQQHKDVIIDIYGNMPFPDLFIAQHYGNLAIHFDDYPASKGMHIVSLSKKKEIGYFENRAAINFYGTTEYFYTITDNNSWKLYNESGDKIYEEKYRLDVNIIEKDGECQAIALSRRGINIKYIDATGNEHSATQSLKAQLEQQLKQQELDSKKERPNYIYETIPESAYSKNVLSFTIVKALKYQDGEEVYVVSEGGKQGVVNAKGEKLLDIEYDQISSNYQMLFFSKADKKGMANLDGKIILEPKFTAIVYEPYNSRYISIKYDEYWFDADIDGNIFKPSTVEIK